MLRWPVFIFIFFGVTSLVGTSFIVRVVLNAGFISSMLSLGWDETTGGYIKLVP